MKRFSQRSQYNESPDQPTPGLSELTGMVELGMEMESLRLAKRTLRSKIISVEKFNDALNAILTFQNMAKAWAPRVVSAYARLPKRDRGAARFYMLSFHYCMHDYEAAAAFIPRRFGGDQGLSELAFAMETLLGLDRMDEMERLVRKIPHALKVAEHPLMQAQLLGCWAEYHARKGNWKKAIELWEILELDETMSRDGVIGIVEIHVTRALREIRRGFQLIQEFNKHFDPGAEIIVPGNDKALQQEAERKFLRLQKILEKIVPKERQRELGIVIT